MWRNRRQRGLTLIEIIAALSLAGFVMLGGQLLLDQLSDSGVRIGRQSEAAAREGNGERLLRRLLRDAMVPPDSERRFRGDTLAMEYQGRCEAPAGWLEPCPVKLAIDLRPDSSVLVAELSSRDPLVLRRLPGAAEFRYYDPSRPDSAWVVSWGTSVSLPKAIGVVVPGDTLLLPVGPPRE